MEIDPIGMRLGVDGHGHLCQVLAIAATAPDGSGPYLVHCVLDDNRYERIQSYIARVASRHPREQHDPPSPSVKHLTDREREILSRLARDESLHEIAFDLYVSYSTVRNHVQHILSKIGVHSITEAVALYLLAED